MTPEEAKLILASYRPNGADHSDPAFEDALQLATTNPELGQWLAEEMAKDSDFADCLASLPIPENLRENLFEVLAARIDSPGYDDFDREFVDALADISPPPSLRDEILAAMAVEQKLASFPAKKNNRSQKKRSLSLRPTIIAAAACLAIALLWSYLLPGPTRENNNLAQSSETVSPATVESQSLAYLSDRIELDLHDPNQETLYQYLASNNLPTPDELPAGLRNVTGVGCREMKFNNQSASLICYQIDENKPIVHLIVLRREDVTDDFPNLAKAKDGCQGCKKSGWSIAKWDNEEKAFFLFSQMQPPQLAAVF